MAVDKLELHYNRKTKKLNKISFHVYILVFSREYFRLLLIFLYFITWEYNVRMQNVSIIGGFVSSKLINYLLLQKPNLIRNGES
jgi:hypothetical protein